MRRAVQLCKTRMTIDATHDAHRESLVESANGHPDFPIQNLPLCMFSRRGEVPRGGIAIGERNI